jgi:putative hydrolase of the HAD superfamily
VILILDCDNTLYPASANVMEVNDVRIQRYIREVMGFPPEVAEEKRLGYLREYGTTLGGLMAEEQVDPEEFLAYVHNYELDGRVAPNPALAAFLAGLEIPRVILTSACASHAQKVMAALGVGACIDRIYDLKAVDYRGKPNPHAYQRVLRDYPGEKAVFVDDRMLNLPPAKDLGIINVWVNEGWLPARGEVTPALSVFYEEAKRLQERAGEFADFTIQRVEQLADLWPQVQAKAAGR